MASYFQQVGDFHSAFGHPCETTPQLNIFDDKPDLIKLRMALIKEEFTELTDAVNQKDGVEVADALFDLTYVICGMAQVMGIDMDRAFEIGQASNMSKLCSSEEEAKQTIEHLRMTMKNQDANDRYEYVQSKDNKYAVYRRNDVDKGRDGKIMKSINFKSPDFKGLWN